jgi:hypothetical protein
MEPLGRSRSDESGMFISQTLMTGRFSLTRRIFIRHCAGSAVLALLAAGCSNGGGNGESLHDPVPAEAYSRPAPAAPTAPILGNGGSSATP